MLLGSFPGQRGLRVTRPGNRALAEGSSVLGGGAREKDCRMNAQPQARTLGLNPVEHSGAQLLERADCVFGAFFLFCQELFLVFIIQIQSMNRTWSTPPTISPIFLLLPASTASFVVHHFCHLDSCWNPGNIFHFPLFQYHPFSTQHLV